MRLVIALGIIAPLRGLAPPLDILVQLISQKLAQSGRSDMIEFIYSADPIALFHAEALALMTEAAEFDRTVDDHGMAE
jgi:hypothetical protein